MYALPHVTMAGLDTYVTMTGLDPATQQASLRANESFAPADADALGGRLGGRPW
jgi:hypothetical protein